MAGSLQRRLAAGEFAITTEITPPVSADPRGAAGKGTSSRRPGRRNQRHRWSERAIAP